MKHLFCPSINILKTEMSDKTAHILDLWPYQYINQRRCLFTVAAGNVEGGGGRGNGDGGGDGGVNGDCTLWHIPNVIQGSLPGTYIRCIQQFGYNISASICQEVGHGNCLHML